MGKREVLLCRSRPKPRLRDFEKLLVPNDRKWLGKARKRQIATAAIEYLGNERWGK